MTRAACRSAILGAALFVYLTAELLPVGAQAELASGFHASASQIGLLLTVYAIVAGIATLPGVHLTRSCDQRTVLVGAMVLLAVAQLGFSFVNSVALAAVWRGLAALAHGVLWSQATVVAARMAPPGQVGRAGAAVFVGSSLGLIAGAPITSMVAAHWGWRVSSIAIAGAAVMCAAGLRWLLPALPPLRSSDSSDAAVGTQLRMNRLAVALVCIVTTVAVTGHYTSYAFIEPLAQRIGLRGNLFGLSLVIFGVTGLVGVWLTGRVLDRRPALTQLCVLGLMMCGIALLAYGLGVPSGIVAVALWGAGAAALPVVLNTAALNATEAGKNLASGVYVLAYQVGISAGSALGGVLLSRTSIGVLAGVSVGFLGVALALSPLMRRREVRRRTANWEAVPADPR